MTREDADFILELRGDPERSRYLHPVGSDPDAQRQWLDAYFQRPGDYYFVIENRSRGSREGTAGIYNIDTQKNTGEWGRWIVREGSGGAIEGASLVYRIAFERLGLDSVFCRTVAANRAALEIHRRFGLEQVATLRGFFESGGRPLDGIEMRLTRARWCELQAKRS